MLWKACLIIDNLFHNSNYITETDTKADIYDKGGFDIQNREDVLFTSSTNEKDNLRRHMRLACSWADKQFVVHMFVLNSCKCQL